MADRDGVARRPLVGRAGEVAALVGLMEGAAGGEGGALLISGEAGVGKTALVREACARVADGIDEIWGSCLPLMSLAVPFLPLASALRGWAAGRDLPLPLPVLGGSGGEGPAGFDTWLAALCRQHPVVLVIDDLQWADQSSLDVLMYVLAGLAGRRLAVITTVRAGEESDPLRRWLADVRRFPGVGELHLGRLDRVGTGEQLAGLLGRPPHQSLVDDVHDHSRGNAYLTTLLVRGLSPDARSLPAGLPTDLREAATHAWRGLSAPAQALTQLVAVAGRPQRGDQLEEVAAATGVRGHVVPLLREAVDGAVLDAGAEGTYWFTHPLLGEVLEEELLPEERKTLHAAFAAALKPVGDPDEMDVEQVVDLADHQYRAGHLQEAYRWALLGAEAAEQAGGASETLRLLRRALDVWPQVSNPGPSKIDLLRRIQTAAEQAGMQEAELAAIDDLLALVDRDRQPLLAAELLVRRMRLRQSTGREFAALDDVREAVRISSEQQGSDEHALAVAGLAYAELWHNDRPGLARAKEAITLARACGSAKALTYALTAQVMAGIFAGSGSGFAEAQEAQRVAAAIRDFWAFVHATLWSAVCLNAMGRDAGEHLRLSREEMTSSGAPHPYISWLSAVEAVGLLEDGNWRACIERLRVALGSTPGPMGDTSVRLTAALLAVRQGREADARGHLARAEEVFTEQSGFLTLPFDAVRAELAMATGDTGRAYTAALNGVAGVGELPALVERLLPLAARALADEAEAFRDRHEDPAPTVARLHDMRSRYPDVVAETRFPGTMYQAKLRAMQAWYNAEVQRGQVNAAVATTWQHAAQTCADAGLAWDEAYAWWRAAQALSKDRTARGASAEALRRAHALAVDLRAAPLLAEVEALADTARISLAAVKENPRAEAEYLPGLTPREREVLAHVVAGRTYGEIARALVLSEKTVSVHISHLLHKTGTANRIELAQLARRVGSSAAD